MADREAEQIGRALRRLRHKAGEPSYREIERGVVEILGRYAPGAETIRLYHAGRIHPERADLILITALARYYQVSMSDLLSNVIVERFEPAKELMTRTLAWIYSTEVAA